MGRLSGVSRSIGLIGGGVVGSIWLILRIYAGFPPFKAVAS